MPIKKTFETSAASDDRNIAPTLYILLTLSNIAELNKKHRGINLPTDVISISHFDDYEDSNSDLTFDEFVGEIFISLPFAKIQAKKLGHSLREEVEFLFVHGLLHVFGFDHVKPQEAFVMEDLTYKILGVPNKGK